MKYLSFWDYFSLIRSLVFLLVAFESYFLGRLYRMASHEMKGTPIIRSMQVVFFSVSIMFTFLSLVAFTNRSVTVYSEILKALLCIPALFLLFSLSKFRETSLDEQVKAVSAKINKL